MKKFYLKNLEKINKDPSIPFFLQDFDLIDIRHTERYRFTDQEELKNQVLLKYNYLKYNILEVHDPIDDQTTYILNLEMIETITFWEGDYRKSYLPRDNKFRIDFNHDSMNFNEEEYEIAIDRILESLKIPLSNSNIHPKEKKIELNECDSIPKSKSKHDSKSARRERVRTMLEIYSR